MKEKIKLLMNKLDITEQEAKELIAADDEINRDTSLKDPNLTKEQEKIVKEMKRAATAKKAPIAYNWDNRGKARKENTLKINIMQALFQLIKETYDPAAELVNKDNTLDFNYGGKYFSVKLIQHRKRKD